MDYWREPTMAEELVISRQATKDAVVAEMISLLGILLAGAGALFIGFKFLRFGNRIWGLDGTFVIVAILFLVMMVWIIISVIRAVIKVKRKQDYRVVEGVCGSKWITGQDLRSKYFVQVTCGRERSHNVETTYFTYKRIEKGARIIITHRELSDDSSGEMWAYLYESED